MAVFDILNGIGAMSYWLAGLVIVAILLWHLSPVPIDPREPKYLAPKIPIVGHIVGMYQHGMKYMKLLSAANKEPALTLTIMKSKIYLVTSPPLIQAAMRNKSLSFDVLTLLFTERMIGASPESMKILKGEGYPRVHSQYMSHIFKIVSSTLSPGPSLWEMNANFLETVSGSLDKLQVEQDLDLFLWLRTLFTRATDVSLFGGNGVLKNDPYLTASLWKLDDELVGLLLSPIPSITSPSVYKARTNLQDAFWEWHSSGASRARDVSLLIKERMKKAREFGISERETAVFEIGLLFVSTINAIPTVFWLLMHIFADHDLLSQLRQEVLSMIEDGPDDHKTVDITRYAQDCPLLVSAYNETLRLIIKQGGIRLVTEDTLITYTESDGSSHQVLFKKDAFVQMPMEIAHLEPSIWGPTVNEFDPRRFQKSDEGAESREAEKLRRQAFYPFGGGKTLCPGRHFAFAEIMGTVTALILGFEMTAPRGRPFVVPDMVYSFGQGVVKPVEWPRINLKRKAGWERVKWKFIVTAQSGFDEKA